MTMTVEYDPSVFNVGNIVDAQKIILTPEDGLSTMDRWERETPYLTDLILQNVKLDENSKVLDYGCGIGRMAKALIEKTGCTVVGADITSSMRALAMAYVDHPNFVVCHPQSVFDGLFTNGEDNEFDLTISIWVLQHVLDPKEVLENIETDKFFIVNEGTNGGRVLPSKQGRWFSDGGDMVKILFEHFGHQDAHGKLDPAVVTQAVSDRTFWALY